MFLKFAIATLVAFYSYSVRSASVLPVPNVIFIDPSMANKPAPPRVTFKSAAESIKNLFANSIQSFSSASQQQMSSPQPSADQHEPSHTSSGPPGVIVIEGNRKRANNMIIVMSPTGQASVSTTPAPESSLESPEIQQFKALHGIVDDHTHDRATHEQLSGSERIQVGSIPSFVGYGSPGGFQSYQTPEQFAQSLSMTSGSGQNYQFQGQTFQPPPEGSYYQPPIQVPPPGYPRIMVDADVRAVTEKEKDDTYEEDESRERSETVSSKDDEPKGSYTKMMKSMMKQTDKEMMKMMQGMMKEMKGYGGSNGKEKKSGGDEEKYPSKGGEDEKYPSKGGDEMEEMKYEEEEEMGYPEGGGGGGGGGFENERGKGSGGKYPEEKGEKGGGTPDKGCSEEDMKMMKDMMMMQMMMMGKLAGGSKMNMSPCKKMMSDYPMEPSSDFYGPYPEPAPYSPPYTHPPVTVEHHHHHSPPPPPPSYHSSHTYHPPISPSTPNGYSSTYKYPIYPRETDKNSPSVPSQSSTVQSSTGQHQSSVQTSSSFQTPSPPVVAPGQPCPTTHHVHQSTNNNYNQNDPPGSAEHTYIKLQVQPGVQQQQPTVSVQQQHQSNQLQSQYQTSKGEVSTQIPVFTAKSVPGQNQEVSNHIIDGIILEEDTPSQGHGQHSWIIKTNSNGNLLNNQHPARLQPVQSNGRQHRQSTTSFSSSAPPSFSPNNFYQPNLLSSGSSVSTASQDTVKNKKKYYRPPGHDRMFIDKLTRESLENGKNIKDRESGSEVIREVYSDTHRIEVIKRLGAGSNDGTDNVRQRALRGK